MDNRQEWLVVVDSYEARAASQYSEERELLDPAADSQKRKCLAAAAQSSAAAVRGSVVVHRIMCGTGTCLYATAVSPRLLVPHALYVLLLYVYWKVLLLHGRNCFHL